MLGKFSKGRHVIVGAAVALMGALAGLGVIGGRSPERFDARTIVVTPEGDTALRITEYIDIDFGDAQRRGYLRLIPNDFGTPTDVSASSPDAADDLAVFPYAEYTEIRVGDPDRTFTGQHRYELAYTLPDARYERVALDYGDDRHLAVDLASPPGGVYPGDRETERFEVIVTGFELANLHCDVGGLRAEGGCDFVDAGDGTYRAVLEPLEEDAGLTVGGTLLGFTDPVEIAAPSPAERRGSGPNPVLVALGFVGLGGLGALGVYWWARRRGRNEVFAGGAADAAYGALPPPGTATAPPPVSLVTDDDLGEFATVEFVPPKGIAPWQGHVLLTERCGDDAVEAWLSGLVGREAIEIEEHGDELSISTGPRRNDLPANDAALLDDILSIDDPYVTGKYDKRFAAAWAKVHRDQVARIADSGWWKQLPPGSGLRRATRGQSFPIISIFFLIWLGSTFTAFAGLFRSWPAAVVLGVSFPALVAFFMYRVMLPARSAQGSALALQTESFRRFLHASEGHHVEWAWSQGLLREYSAWSVALGEADAWSAALDRANVPVAASVAAAPIFVHTHGSSVRDAHTAPSSSGSGGGGGGGFSGGGAGGGGGGGSSGSW